MARHEFDLIIVGSGPGGIATANHAKRNGMNYVLLERTDHLSDTIYCYQARKYVMAEPSLIPPRSDVPFQAGSREQILDAWEKHAKEQQLNVHYRQEVKDVKKQGDRFHVTTAVADEYVGKWVVLAMGTQGAQRKPGVPGEELPHVYFRLVDAAEFKDQDIVVVGAGDSAIEIAVALADENRVSLIVRTAEILRAKEANTREVLSRAATGGMMVYYNTTMKEVYPEYVDLNVRGETVRVPAKHIFLKLGADPPRKFFEGIGIKYTGKDKDARPILTQVYETTVPGIFLIGAAGGKDLIKFAMNQGWEVVEHLMGRPVEPADEAVLKERLPFWQGTVLERIGTLKQRIPLFGVCDDEQLREMFMTARVKEYKNGETIINQNDFTTDILVVTEGNVDILVRPEGSNQTRHVATIAAGNFFGEMSLLSGRRRTATAKAQGTARLIEIPRKAMLKLLLSSPKAKAMIDQAFLIRAVQGYMFPDTPPSELAELVAKATLETLPKDSVVFKEGDPGDAFYLIRNGQVKIAKTSGDREVVLAYLVAGNFFGESALLTDEERSATVTTIFPCELIKLSKKDFDAFLQPRPALRQKVLDKLNQRQVDSLKKVGEAGASSDILSKMVEIELVMGTQSLIIDDHKCVRCSNCIRACEGVHVDGQARLSLTGIHLYNLLAPNSCWQCENPMCMLDCPPDALARDPRGEVYIKSNCIGCGNCERNCPYGNIFMVHPKPKMTLFGWVASLFKKEKHDEIERTVAVKCDLCREIKGGPACVRACPTGAAIRLTPEEYKSTLEQIVVTTAGGGK